MLSLSIHRRVSKHASSRSSRLLQFKLKRLSTDCLISCWASAYASSVLCRRSSRMAPRSASTKHCPISFNEALPFITERVSEMQPQLLRQSRNPSPSVMLSSCLAFPSSSGACSGIRLPPRCPPPASSALPLARATCPAAAGPCSRRPGPYCPWHPGKPLNGP